MRKLVVQGWLVKCIFKGVSFSQVQKIVACSKIDFYRKKFHCFNWTTNFNII